jgi:DNA-3-methyladenine glycosylase I
MAAGTVKIHRVIPRGRGSGKPLVRCGWAARAGPEQEYHDREWGVPERDDARLLELIVLEGAQAGLSWSTILRKREGYRRAFAGFDRDAMAAFDAARIDALVADPAIVRHRGKIESAVANARAAVAAAQEHGSLAAFLWGLVDGAPLQPRRAAMADLPASTPASAAMSRALRRAGFRFVGPTTCYSLMQAAGMVNDHLVSCFRHAEVEALEPTSGV